LIGTKTIATLGLLAGGFALAGALDSLSLERIVARGPGALFLIGCFAAVVGTLMFRFWRLGEPSGHYFRWARDATLWETEAQLIGTGGWRITIGENRHEALDLGPRAQRLICIAIALLLALASIGSRALDLLGRFRHSVTSPNATYCPEVEKVDTALDPNAPGCELVRRAYALGYAQSLGDCEARTRTQATGAPCTLRQRDEPLLHYSWRRLDGFWASLRQNMGSAHTQKLWRDFVARFHRMDALRKAEEEVLGSAPHASHHIFTNLPDPKNGAFREATCADRYRWLAHRPPAGSGATRASLVFEHVVGQLLFESRYEPAAGYCREYQVHWGAPTDICQRIAASPEATLDRLGALPSVRAALERYALGKELESLAVRQRPLGPSSIVSFQCYLEGEAPERKSTDFSLDGFRFTAEEIHVPVTKAGSVLYVDRYDAVAKLFVRGFHYGALLSQAGLEQTPTAGAETSLARHDNLLMRLYGLEGFDIYLDPAWIADRPDLLEVYPYQIHLKNYVQMFRRQYRLERGRL